MAWSIHVVVLLLIHVSVTSSANRTSSGNGCTFRLVNPLVRDELNEALGTGVKLMKFHIHFKNYPDDILNMKGGTLYIPTMWLRSTNRQGQSLLMLDDNFEVLSLSLLRIGVTDMYVELEDSPYGCMTDLTNEERVNKTRLLLLNDFKVPENGQFSGSLNKNERICNMRIKSHEGRASFWYHCCHHDPDGHVICEDVSRDMWINVLLVCIIVIKVLVVLYSPSFLPETFYRKKFTAVDYLHKIPAGKRKKRIKVVKTMYPGAYTSQNPPLKLDLIEGLEYFKLSLNSMQIDRIYDLKLDRIRLSAKSRKLLPENYVPVSILKMIYENVFRCKMRSIPVLKPCCDTGVCGIIDMGCKVITWFKCLRIVAKLILLFILAIPWIIRLVIYFTYEAVRMEHKRQASENLGLKLPFIGSFTLYLTPLHGLFVAIYIVVTIDSFAYGLLGKKMKERFKFILRKCLRDMRERSRLSAYGWAIGLALLPFKRFGIIGFILAPIYFLFLIPCMLPIIAFYTFPALNLSIRLIIHLFIFLCPNKVFERFQKMSSKLSGVKENLKLNQVSDEEEFQGKENLSKRETCIQLAIILMCLTSFWSLTFLLMECLSFFVEVGVYTLMGIIVNAGATLKYLTLIFLIGLYAKNSFGGVYNMYLDYHKIIRNILLGKKHDEIKTAARQEERFQESTAFRVMSSLNAADTTSGIGIEVKDDLLRWQTSGLLVFLDSLDQPFTPAKFFFETIDMNYCGCPGKLWQNTLYAFYDFAKILVFLMFVVIVVLAFGNQFSTTNQMLATLAGGFVPFVFRNVFSKGSAAFTVDTESVQFSTEFDKAVAGYTQKWPIADIIPSSISESGLSVEADDISITEDDKEATTDFNANHDEPDATTAEETPLVESNDIHINIETESVDSETDNTKVDLIIDFARFDKMNRRLGMEGSIMNVAGSMSMLGDGNAPIYKPPHDPARVIDV